jgi:adenylate cyclase
VEQSAVGGASNLPSTAIQVNTQVFIFSSIALFSVGILMGTIELLYLKNIFAKKSFSKKILFKLLIYLLLMFIITMITFPIAASLELNTSILDHQVWNKLYNYLTSITHLSTDVQMAVSIGASLFYSEMSDNIGHRVLINFFTGKYHTPKEENRIFMFLDMKSSTTIAEHIGHIKYFELLKEYYADLSDSTIRFAGEIYQYVGDEMVISWKYKDGISNNNCIECFFAMKNDLLKRKEKYIKKYGLFPSFKAGIHYGKVTTGEIGSIKKDIIFTGDVLNATARIQGLCNSYEVDLLISADLLENLTIGSAYQIKSIGIQKLRGKKENVELFKIDHLNK